MNKIVYENRVSCVICGNQHLVKQIEIEDYDANLGSFDLLLCPECGMYYTSPYPTEETLSCLYQSRETQNFDNDDSVLFNFLKDFLLKKQIKNIKANSFVDFGTGNARLACMLKELNPNSDVTAVDFCRETPARLKNKKYSSIKYVYTEDFFESETKYDVIFLKHVLEHTLNPIEFLEKINNKLNVDGSLIIEVPNVNSGVYKTFKKCSYQYYPPFHIVHFTPENLKYTLEKLNYPFTVSKVEMPVMSNVIANLFHKPLNNWFRLLGVILHPVQFFLNRINNSSTALLAIVKKTK